MKLWVGVTDKDWYEHLVLRAPDEVNFWQPSGSREFRVLQAGEPFLFKLHFPDNFIVGGGFFVRYSALPASLAWTAFEQKNGVASLDELRQRVCRYRARRSEIEIDPVIGCNVLTEPFFLPREEWIPIPGDWARNIVSGKSYTTESEAGRSLWEAVMHERSRLPGIREREELPDEPARFGAEYLTRGRLGQGAFRVLVTDAYQRRCAVTGEKTLPVLEAAHIRPFSKEGPHRISNGILLRSDLHKLFDLGYLTVTPELRLEVSGRLREEWHNGRAYYAHHGQQLAIHPADPGSLPRREYLQWHNENVFKS